MPAGNNPQHRDAVVVLRQLRQGLERLAENLNLVQKRCDGLLADAKGVRTAISFFLQGDENVSHAKLQHNEVDVTERWMRGPEYAKIFSFFILDRTDIPSYFDTEQ